MLQLLQGHKKEEIYVFLSFQIVCQKVSVVLSVRLLDSSVPSATTWAADGGIKIAQCGGSLGAGWEEGNRGSSWCLGGPGGALAPRGCWTWPRARARALGHNQGQREEQGQRAGEGSGNRDRAQEPSQNMTEGAGFHCVLGNDNKTTENM